MLPKRAVWICLLLYIFVLPLQGFDFFEPYVRNFSVSEGLSSSQINYVFQDSKGYLWFASEQGLTRYDGQSFQSFNTTDGLVDNHILFITEDPNGRLWFASHTGHLSFYENGTFHPHPQNASLDYYGGLIPISLSADNNHIWLGTSNIGIIYLGPEGMSVNHKTDRLHIHQHGSEFMIGTLTESPDSLLEISIHKEDQVFAEFAFPIETPFTPSYQIIEDGKEGYFLALGKQVIHLEQGKISSQRKFEAEVKALYIDQKKRLWVGVNQSQGAFIFDQADLKNDPLRILRDHTINCINEDYERGIWIATKENGAYYAENLEKTSFSKTAGLSSNELLFISGNRDGSVSIIAYPEGVADIFSQCTYSQKYDLNHQGKINYLSACYHDTKKDQVYLFGTQGVHHLSMTDITHKVQLRPFPPVSDAIAYGDYVLTVWRDKVRFCDQEIRLTDKELTLPIWADKIALKGDTAFLSTQKGVLVYDLVSQKEIELPFPFHPGMRIVDLHYSPKHDELWIATSGEGLRCISLSTGEHQQWTTHQGLNSDLLNCLYLDTKGLVWVGSNAGFNRLYYDRNSKQSQVASVTVNSGLISNEVTDLFTRQGYVWAATRNGLSRIKESEIDNFELDPFVRISQTLINDSLDFSLQTEFGLDYGQNNMTFRFNGISFREPDLHYKVKLEGHDDQWKTLTLPQIRYTHLAPGDYKLLVKAGKEGHGWSQSPAQLSFQVFAPFWMKAWFIALCILAVLLLVFLIYKITDRRARKKWELQSKMYELELQALRSQMNPHFIFNVLNSIQLFVIRNDPQSSQAFLSKFSRLIRDVLESSRVEFNTFSRELRLMQLYLELERLRFDDRFDFQIDIEEGLEDYLIPTFLLQPHIENSLVHGLNPTHLEGHGKLTISVQSRGDDIECAIEDNGIGRKRAREIRATKKYDKQSLGLLITRDRIAVLNESVDFSMKSSIIDKEGAESGTLVKIRIPKRRA